MEVKRGKGRPKGSPNKKEKRAPKLKVKPDYSGNGRMRTRLLFKQYNPRGELDLNDWRKTFLEIGDPTEYQVALALRGSWADWQAFKVHWPEFRDDILPAWHEELQVKIQSEMVQEMIRRAKADSSSTSAKWVAEGKYRNALNELASQDEPAKLTKQEKLAQKQAEEDVARVLGTNVVPLV